MSSVCNFGRSGSHKLEILETNGTDNPNIFALRSPKAIHLLPGEHGEILERPEVWWGKVACCSTKTAISLKRAKVDENLLWRAYRNSPTLFRTVPFSTLYGLPKTEGSQPQPKTAIAIISGTGKATDCKFGLYIHRVHPNKNPWKIWEKRERGRIQKLPKFLSTPIVSGTGKDTNFKFGRYTFYRVNPNKSPFKIWEKRERGTAHIFWVPPIISGIAKATNWNFVRTFIGWIGIKSIKNFGKSSRGHTHGLSKYFRAHIYRAHRAVIFALAQLSCFIISQWPKWAGAHTNWVPESHKIIIVRSWPQIN